jgi:FixJ family two-component response regulator
MAQATSTVIVIDDDPGIRESISGLVRSVGLQAKLFASVDEFLNAGRPEGPTCLVLDVRLPGRSGLELQRELAAAISNPRSSSSPGMATFRCPSRR